MGSGQHQHGRRAATAAVAAEVDDGPPGTNTRWHQQGRYPYLPFMSSSDQLFISRPYNIREPKQYSPSSTRRPLLFLHTHNRQSHRMSAVGGFVYLLGRESPYLPAVNSTDDIEISPANICSPRLKPRSCVDQDSECKQTFPPRLSSEHHFIIITNAHPTQIPF